MAHDVYISYAHDDENVVREVSAELETAGLKCWYQARDNPNPTIWGREFAEALETCKVLVVIFSSHANASSVIHNEVAYAGKLEKPIVPFRIDHSELDLGLRFSLGRHHAVDAFDSPLAPHARRLAGILQTIVAPPAATTYDVFLSYRRQDGSSTARLIRSELQRRRFRVFLDVDDLRPGHFDEALLTHVENAHHFVLILTPNSLDHCSESGDWLRQELVHALRSKRNIVPIMMPGFHFPEAREIPADIQAIRVHQCLTYSNEFFEAMMEKLVGYLR